MTLKAITTILRPLQEMRVRHLQRCVAQDIKVFGHLFLLCLLEIDIDLETSVSTEDLITFVISDRPHNSLPS